MPFTSSSACLPSLRPIATFVLDKSKQLRKRGSTHKQGSRLLNDISKSGNTPFIALPLSEIQSQDHGQDSIQDTSFEPEKEAKISRTETSTLPHWVAEVETDEQAFENGVDKVLARMNKTSPRQ